MMKFAVQIATATARVLVTIITIAALTLFGADAAARAFEAPSASDEQPNQLLDQDYIGPGAEADKDREDMSPGSRPWTEQAACLHSVLVMPTVQSSRGVLVRTSALAARATNRTTILSHRVFSGTAAEVSSSLGRLTTLVGAKPSGTS